MADIDYKAKYEALMASRKKYTERRNVRIQLMLAKAEKANLRVTDAEVDAVVKGKK